MKVVQTPIKNNYDLNLSDDFGYREFYYNNKYYSGFHKGIDITKKLPPTSGGVSARIQSPS